MANVNKWQLIKVNENVRQAPERINNVHHRLNKKKFIDVLIETLNNNLRPMTARELVEKINEDGTFSFKESAKTPWNSASSRLNTYLKEKGNQSEIRMYSRGKFVSKNFIDYI